MIKGSVDSLLLYTFNRGGSLLLSYNMFTYTWKHNCTHLHSYTHLLYTHLHTHTQNVCEDIRKDGHTHKHTHILLYTHTQTYCMCERIDARKP